MTTTLSADESARLRDGLADICSQAGIDPAGAALIRYTMNAVYRLDRAGVVVRMSDRPDAGRLTHRVVQVAHAFAERDLPTIRLVEGISQPVHAGLWSATVWTLLPQPPEHRFAPVDLAPPLRQLHGVADLRLPLPSWNPVGKARERLLQAAGLQGPHLQFMRHWATSLGMAFEEIISRLAHWCDELDGALETTEWALPSGVIHGDAHTGNLLVDQDGATVMCDFDSTVNGPREWDLVPAAHGPARFGRHADDYAAFALAYGFDVTSWSGWHTLRRVRELQLVTSVIGAVPGRPDVADQLAWRLRSIVNADDSAVWQRYQ